MEREEVIKAELAERKLTGEDIGLLFPLPPGFDSWLAFLGDTRLVAYVEAGVRLVRGKKPVTPSTLTAEVVKAHPRLAMGKRELNVVLKTNARFAYAYDVLRSLAAAEVEQRSYEVAQDERFGGGDRRLWLGYYDPEFKPQNEWGPVVNIGLAVPFQPSGFKEIAGEVLEEEEGDAAEG